MAMIELRRVTKVFGPRPRSVLPLLEDGLDKAAVLERTGHTVGLADVSLSMEAGRTFVVMGLSGCGKSTLLRHLNRLIEPTAGAVEVDGIDVLALSRAELEAFRRQKTGMVFQRFGLFPHRTVAGNVAYGLTVQGVERAARDEAARRWIEAVGLAGYEDAYPDQLSGGMQQRVGLARALATDPDILLMDEPFGALDPLIRRDMQDQLIALQRRLHKTIVFITHDLDEALRLGDRIAILNDGRVVQVGAPDDILLRPADDYVAAFVKDVNRGRVLTAEALMAPPAVVAAPNAAPAEVLARLSAAGAETAFVVNGAGDLVGALDAARAEATAQDGGATVAGCLMPAVTVRREATLDDLVALAVENPGALAVVDGAGRLLGAISRAALAAGLARK